MTTETTRHEPTGTLADLAAAVEALAHLHATNPTLPTVHVALIGTGTCIDLQADTPDTFEQWRAALGAPAPTVELHAYGSASWLQVRADFRGVSVVLFGYGLPITADQARTTQAPDNTAPTVHTLAELSGGAA